MLLASPMSTLDGMLLSDRQISLLDELAAEVGPIPQAPGPGALPKQAVSTNSPGTERWGEAEAYEAFHRHWRSVRGRQQRQEGLKRRGRWHWICNAQEICESACGELQSLLGHVAELERQRCEVLRKTTTLHEQCEQMVQDQERLSAEAEALSEKLDYFDRVADVARMLDHAASGNISVGRQATSEPPAGSSSSSSTALAGSEPGQSDFAVILEQIDGSAIFLEAHTDFCQGQAYMHQFEHLRNRACLLLRSTLQRSLEKSLMQVEQQLKDAGSSQGSVETQVFYTRFRNAAGNYRPLMSLLHQRLDVHETYAVTLEELEGFYVHLRLKLLASPVSSHLGSLVHKDLQMSELAPSTRQASAYILEISQLEKQCFEAHFELRHPQEALRTLLETVADMFYKTMRPLVLACESIDSLREIADCLQMDVLEPNRQRSKNDLAPVLAVISRLHRDVQEKLIYRVELYIRDEIKEYVLTEGDLEYPPILFTAMPEESTVTGPCTQKGWFPTLPRTLSILAKIFRVLEMATFQGLAQEAVDFCVASLKEASQQLAKRSLPSSGDRALQALHPLVQMMDSQLFLVKHLLLLREQVANFECDLVVSNNYFNFANIREALNLKLPDGLLGILKPTVYTSEVDSKKDIEAELKSACESLITNLAAHITQPLVALNTKIGAFLATPGVNKATLKEQPFMRADDLGDIISAFLANVRSRVPFAAAHIRLYLSAAGAGGKDDDATRSSASTSPILFKPVEIRLVDTWGRLEALLEEQQFTAAELESLGFLRPDALRELVTSLFDSVMQAPWQTIVEAVSQVPRATRTQGTPGAGLPAPSAPAASQPEASAGLSAPSAQPVVQTQVSAGPPPSSSLGSTNAEDVPAGLPVPPVLMAVQAEASNEVRAAPIPAPPAPVAGQEGASIQVPAASLEQNDLTTIVEPGTTATVGS